MGYSKACGVRLRLRRCSRQLDACRFARSLLLPFYLKSILRFAIEHRLALGARDGFFRSPFTTPLVAFGGPAQCMRSSSMN